MKKILISVLLSTLVTFNTTPVSINIIAKAEEQTVVFNKNTHKMHKPDCAAAIKCTDNCIKLTKTEAEKRGGIPCKRCGG